MGESQSGRNSLTSLELIVTKDCQKLSYVSDKGAVMRSLAKEVLTYVETQPEGTPLTAKGLLHLSNRAAIDQALSRLAREGEVMRVGRRVYVRPVKTKYGSRSPLTEQVVEKIATARGETIVPSGAAAANALGLTTQVPVKSVYLTSGPSRTLSIGKQSVELRQGAGRAGRACFGMAWAAASKASDRRFEKQARARGA